VGEGRIAVPLTPVDIHNKDFRRSLWGFNEDEVDEFLDQVVQDYEAVLRERDGLREQVDGLTRQLVQYKELEENLQRALVVAQSTAEEVRGAARKEAELLIQEAQAKAQRMIEEAQTRVKTLENDFRELERELQVYRSRVRAMLQSQLDLLDHFPTRSGSEG
jgi:cell division initiation protein